MKDIIQQLVQQAIDNMISSEVLPSITLPTIKVERTRDPSHGDLACNAAMVLSKQLRMKSCDLSAILAEKLKQLDDVAAIDIAGPGFINITLKSGIWQKELIKILKADFVLLDRYL